MNGYQVLSTQYNMSKRFVPDIYTMMATIFWPPPVYIQDRAEVVGDIVKCN